MSSKPGQGIGCAVAMVIINALLIGFIALGFAEGPYSSRGQELWYRYGSLGFLLAGAILPAVALALGARRPAGLTVALTVWMLVVLVACLGYVSMSGGGV
jgi:hypothetical protein